MTIKIDYKRDGLLPEFSKRTLRDRYMLEDEESPQDTFKRVCETVASDPKHAQRLYDYVSKQWFMFSSPILSNAGTERGHLISCFLNSVPDSRAGLMDHYRENTFLSSSGGGIGGYWGDVRSDGSNTSNGSVSTGSIPFLKMAESQMLAFAQGKTRRGSYAAYQDVSHPEIEEFLAIRKSTGGDPNRKTLNLHHGINIPDTFMEAVQNDSEWALIDPNSKQVTKILKARDLWIRILDTRMFTGEPYLHFIDTTNRMSPSAYKTLGLDVNHSNLCSEITLHTSEWRTAVCCLSSVNIEKYDEWKDEKNFIFDLIEMLDNVISIFTRTCGEELKSAGYSAHRERSLGLGAMGLHSYLQSKGIPFESPMAKGLNLKIFSYIKEEALKASKRLCDGRGPCPDAEVSNQWIRNLHLLAVAPNATSSIICGNTSPSVEPFSSNAVLQKTASGTHLARNKHLEALLERYNENNKETWDSILSHKGSIQHLAYIDEYSRKVFKTAFEIDQRFIIELAGDRQQFICQSQSINLFFTPQDTKEYFHKVHYGAWEKGLKTLYYCRTMSEGSVEDTSIKIEREVRKDNDECLMCEG